MLRISSDPILIDVFPPNDTHNVTARLLRQGLAVSSFALLETYLFSKFEDIIAKVGRTTLTYNSFPADLRHFLTIDALQGLLTKIKQVEKSNRQSFADQHIPTISGFLSTPPTFTSFGFSPTGSNIGHEDIKKGFSALGVIDPWRKLAAIASAIGAGRISLETDYRTLASARHRSAHNPQTNVPTADLQTNIQIAITLGIAFDILSDSTGKIIESCRNITTLTNDINSAIYELRFIDLQLDGSVLERPSLVGRAVKRYTNRAAAGLGASSRARTSHVIVRSHTSSPIALL